jgi:uncharacterized protein YpiB (UPF0302 family)
MPALAKIIMITFFFNYNIEDYLIVMEHADDIFIKEKWRNKILEHGRLGCRDNNQQAIQFFFELAFRENKIKKMISYISTYTPYDLILRHFDIMIKSDKNDFLRALLVRSSWPSYEEQPYTQEELNKILDAIFQKLIQHFPLNVLLHGIKTYHSYSINRRENDLV